MKNYPAKLLKRLEEHLTVEKKTLKERLATLNLEDPFTDPERLNDNAASDTEAKEEVDHERIEALKQDIQIKLDLVDHSLSRIRKGKYGFCEMCTEMIDTDRLAANPTARYCMACQQKIVKK
ncbi:MAG: TraR/DksA C4-type zinc finger protein [Patescibacteria group bacterium]|nr:TraR/DksA C4-type zinc finger protein [Patescibacteria group bacterium]